MGYETKRNFFGGVDEVVLQTLAGCGNFHVTYGPLSDRVHETLYYLRLHLGRKGPYLSTFSALLSTPERLLGNFTSAISFRDLKMYFLAS